MPSNLTIVKNFHIVFEDIDSLWPSLFVIVSLLLRRCLCHSMHSSVIHSGPEDCDIFSGQWIPSTDPVPYTSATCPYISSHQSCLLNGRTDIHFLKWRFKPHGCDLDAFDAKQLLNSMRGKSIAFLGDSLSRNQMESLLCLLNEVRDNLKPLVSIYYLHLVWQRFCHVFQFSYYLFAGWAAAYQRKPNDFRVFLC